MYIYVYIIYTYIYVYIYIYQFESHVMMCCIKQKILKTHIFCKIFRFLYRSFVSFIYI